MVFVPDNKLERSLVAAATDPAARPQFYRDLVESDVFVVQGGPVPEASGKRTFEVDEEVTLRNLEVDGTVYLPVFSSLARLQAALTEPAGYLALNAKTLMEITRGTPLLLNPGADYGKELTVDEIASILDGSLWRPVSQYEVERDTEVMIGEPAVYPQELVDALTRIFKRLKPVRRAYLAHFFNPTVDERPHTLVAVEATGDWDAVLAEAGVATRQVEIPDPPVDYLRLTGGGGVQDYFLEQCEPFYRAKRLRLF